MNLIDDKGRLFGTVNIIDALVVLLMLAVTAAGTAFVIGSDGQNSTNQTQTTATLEITSVQPYVANAILEGPVQTDAIVAIENKSVRPTEVVVADRNGTLHQRPHLQNKTVTMQVVLNVTASNGETMFRGRELELGRKLTLDLGPATVNGTVTGLLAGR